MEYSNKNAMDMSCMQVFPPPDNTPQNRFVMNETDSKNDNNMEIQHMGEHCTRSGCSRPCVMSGREMESRKMQNREMPNQEMQHREMQNREMQHREMQHREMQNREMQHREMQNREMQHREMQNREMQHREIQHRQAQNLEMQHQDSQNINLRNNCRNGCNTGMNQDCNTEFSNRGMMNNITPVPIAGRMAIDNFRPLEQSSNFTVGMSYVPLQRWERTYDLTTALRRGTIFPSLDLPFMMGRCK